MHQSDGVREGRTALVALGVAVMVPLILAGLWLSFAAWRGNDIEG